MSVGEDLTSLDLKFLFLIYSFGSVSEVFISYLLDYFTVTRLSQFSSQLSFYPLPTFSYSLPSVPFTLLSFISLFFYLYFIFHSDFFFSISHHPHYPRPQLCSFFPVSGAVRSVVMSCYDILCYLLIYYIILYSYILIL
jgi:hypothetical protein